LDLAIKLDNPDPALKKINEFEIQRKPLEKHIARLELEHSMQSALANITETQVSGILKNFTENFRSMPKERWKESIRPLGRAHYARPRDFRLLHPLQVCSR